MLTTISSLAILVAGLVACSGSNSSSARDDSGALMPRPNANAIETILKEDGHYSSGLETRTTMVANTRGELERMWRLVYADQTPAPRPPEVDFSRESVVMATPGLKNTGGHSVTIEALEEVPEGMRLIIVEEAPGQTCMTTQALTTPVHIVRTRKLPSVVLFEWREEVRECE